MNPNLKPRWVKGQSGNPKGRAPAIKTIPDLLRWSGALQAPSVVVAKMREVYGLSPDTELTVDQACILRSRIEAMNGCAKHLQFWAERTEGKSIDTLRLEDGRQLEIVTNVIRKHSTSDAGRSPVPAKLP